MAAQIKVQPTEWKLVAVLTNGQIVERTFVKRSSLARACRKLVNKGVTKSLRVFDRAGTGRWKQFQFTDRWNYYGNGAYVNVADQDDVHAFDFIAA